MGVLKKLASQTLIYGMSSIIGRVVVWGFTPIFTQCMATGEYGIFSDLYAFITYFLVILTFGMETAFFRFAKSDKLDTRAYDSSFSFIGILGISFFLLFTLANPIFSDWLGYGDRPTLVYLMAAIILLDVITALPLAKLRYDERPMVFALVSLGGIFMNVVLNIWFFIIQEENTADYVFIANLWASIFKVFILIVLSIPSIKIPKLSGVSKIQILPQRFKLDWEILKPMAGFGAFIMAAGLLGMISQNSDVNFIKRIWGDLPLSFRGTKLTGEEMAGIYSANKKLAVLILLVTQAFRYAAEPFFFRHSKESGDKTVYAKVFHYFMLASFATGMLIASFTFELVSFKVFGFRLIAEDYWLGLDAVPLMLGSFILFGAFTNFSIWYKLTKQVRFGLLLSLTGAFIIVVLNTILIGTLGYTGANIATFSGYLVMTSLTYLLGQKYYPIPYRIDRLGVYLLILGGVWLLNSSIGNGVVGDLIFFKKLVISICGLVIVFMIEKAKPLFKETTPS